VPDEELEGFNENGSTTKVVDRRWYEKNKHIFPASVWENFDSAKDYTTGIRKDTDGNVYFFSTLNGKKA
jgi:protein FAM50